jgi:putative phosphoesterase
MNWRHECRPGRLRIALLADSHGWVAPKVLDAIAVADFIIHAGDMCGGNVLRALRCVAPVIAVAGNNDTSRYWGMSDAHLLNDLPDALEVTLDGGVLVVVHGHQWRSAATRHARMRASYPGARMIVYGHSHRRVIDCDRAPWVVNPGASGRVRTFGGPSWIGLTVDGDTWCVEPSALATL